VGERCRFTWGGGGLTRFPIQAEAKLAGRRKPMRPRAGVGTRGKPQRDELGDGRVRSVRRVSSGRANPEISGILYIKLCLYVVFSMVSSSLRVTAEVSPGVSTV
jgi:hypothetical protein